MSNHSPIRSTVLILAFVALTAAALGASVAGAADEPSRGSGTLNFVAADKGKVNITHGPIPVLGWPAMTMDFRLADGVSLEGIEPGAKVDFQLRKLPDGAYQIESLSRQKE